MKQLYYLILNKSTKIYKNKKIIIDKKLHGDIIRIYFLEMSEYKT